MHWGGYGWGMGFGWLFMIIVTVLLIMGVVFVIRAMSGQRPAGGEETARDVLKKRYAQGEITKEEYERIRDDIGETKE